MWIVEHQTESKYWSHAGWTSHLEKATRYHSLTYIRALFFKSPDPIRFRCLDATGTDPHCTPGDTVTLK